MTMIRVRGESRVQATPDVATIQVHSSAQDPSAQVAFEAMSRRSTELAAALDRESVPVECRATSSIRVNRRIEWNGTENVDRGFEASITIVLTLPGHLAEPTAVAGLCAALAGDTAITELVGPAWQCSAGHPARSEARTLAAIDAQSRGNDYATTLGLRVTGIVDVVEPGTRGPGGSGGTEAAPMMVKAMHMSGPMSEPTVDAGTIDIDAAVEVTFDAIS